MKIDWNGTSLWWLPLGLMMALMVGCAGPQVVPQSPMDSPAHHVTLGDRLLEKGDLERARTEFERALTLDEEYCPAHVGLALVTADGGDSEQAFELMKTARKYADSTDAKVLYHTGMIRLYTSAQDKKWLKQANSHYRQAVKLDDQAPGAHFYMARAWRVAEDYDHAAYAYQRVIDIDGQYVQQADDEWAAVQRILRALPGTVVGREIARRDGISRADVAALFVEEMNLPKIFRQHQVVLKKGAATAEGAPVDFKGHVLQNDIVAVNALGIKGLEIIGQRFDPDAAITRANFAMMIEDILVKITREDDLPLRYIDSASPFGDVNAGFYAKNAIMTCTTRGIMKADLYGNFRPDQGVSGAEALLIIRRFNEALKY